MRLARKHMKYIDIHGEKIFIRQATLALLSADNIFEKETNMATDPVNTISRTQPPKISEIRAHEGCTPEDGCQAALDCYEKGEAQNPQWERCKAMAHAWSNSLFPLCGGQISSEAGESANSPAASPDPVVNLASAVKQGKSGKSYIQAGGLTIKGDDIYSPLSSSIQLEPEFRVEQGDIGVVFEDEPLPDSNEDVKMFVPDGKAGDGDHISIQQLRYPGSSPSKLLLKYVSDIDLYVLDGDEGGGASMNRSYHGLLFRKEGSTWRFERKAKFADISDADAKQNGEKIAAALNKIEAQYTKALEQAASQIE